MTTSISMDAHARVTTSGQLDEHGDQILCEALINRRAVKRLYTRLLIAFGIITFCLGLPILIPLYIFYYSRFVQKWRVYVTSKGIYYSDLRSALVGVGLCSKKPLELIPIQNIADISVAQGTADVLWVRLRPVENTAMCCVYNLDIEGVFLSPIMNPDEFMAAVKREIQRQNA